MMVLKRIKERRGGKRISDVPVVQTWDLDQVESPESI
jgi:hypothetical protein